MSTLSDQVQSRQRRAAPSTFQLFSRTSTHIASPAAQTGTWYSVPPTCSVVAVVGTMLEVLRWGPDSGT
jgi:hypothetical protein